MPPLKIAPWRVADLPEEIEDRLLARFDERLHPMGWRPAPHLELTTALGNSAASRALNRYPNIVPYDHNCVRFSHPRLGELAYFNGSIIDGLLSGGHRHVATQGPLPHTVDPLWASVWHLGLRVIVQVTDPVQDGRIKFDPYLPEGAGESRYGPVNVRVEEATVEAVVEGHQGERLLRRRLWLTLDGQERALEHWHYVGWQDHGAPDLALLNVLVERTEAAVCALDGGMLVHCSAGVGRTGTFLLAAALRQLRAAGEAVDLDRLDALVVALRAQRMFVVESGEQYLTLCLLSGAV